MSAYGQILHPTVLKEVHAGERSGEPCDCLGNFATCSCRCSFVGIAKCPGPSLETRNLYRVCSVSSLGGAHRPISTLKG